MFGAYCAQLKRVCSRTAVFDCPWNDVFAKIVA